MTDRPPESRRERQRRELTSEILAIARRQLESTGAGGVSWRGIAREVGMNPASLYTYFPSLDDLFTALVLESHRSLAQAIVDAEQAAIDRSPYDRALACALAYRTWALEHTGQFNLIFTDQLPGYAAPPDGPTVDAQIEMFGPFLRAMTEYLDLPDGELPPDTLSDVMGLRCLLHGLVTLEVNHHLPFIDDHEALLVDQLARSMTSLRPTLPRSSTTR